MQKVRTFPEFYIQCISKDNEYSQQPEAILENPR